VSEYFDIRCGDDLDPFARDVPPLETLAQDIYHLLITNKGTLFLDPDWGLGLESYLGRPIPTTLAGDIENEVRRDDRVSGAKCVITPIDGQVDAYAMVLTVEVEDSFLTIALQLTPDGIVRVS
jgi:phage baseplate assembly protein W